MRERGHQTGRSALRVSRNNLLFITESPSLRHLIRAQEIFVWTIDWFQLSIRMGRSWKKMAIHQSGTFLKIVCYWFMKLIVDYLHAKRKAGDYQARYIFETYLKGRSQGPRWEISVWPFWLYHKSTLWSWGNPLLLPRPQLLLLEDGGGVGKREHEGFSPFIGQRRKRRETDRSIRPRWSPRRSPPPCFPPLPHFLLYLSVPEALLLSPTLKAVK